MEGINDICDTRLKELSTKLPAAILNSKSDNTVKKKNMVSKLDAIGVILLIR
jgi:hypothetical protein